MSFLEPEVAHRRIETNGVTLHVATAGPEDGPLVILLHGFPEFWYGWRRQIGPLAATGFRLFVPDQRGYNLSEKPSPIAAYALELLARDVVGLIDAAGAQKAAIVGHDWGAAVAWWVALRFPTRVQSLAISNVPHPIVFKRHLLRSWAQIRKSWYMGFFQLPLLPERILTRRGGVPFAKAIAHSARRGTFTREELDRYREAWLQPGAASGMLNWYRAALRAAPPNPEDLRIHVPTSILWGAADPLLGVELAQLSLEQCVNGRLELIEGASHWVQHEEPDRLNELLLRHLRENSG